MNLQNSYFSITSPFVIVERWMHPFRRFMNANIQDRAIDIKITRRAEKALHKRTSPMLIEMQLYLSCMVKKRVIFHEKDESKSSKVNDQLSLKFRTVVATACDPVEFAKNYPVKEELNTVATSKLSPSSLKIDYRQDQWIGEFDI
ncbi:hypothetical protein MNBD_GAMMA12-2712 [hydrothermal vent metagenome]|uniref:Uncharacterized protein n=1 Tax=hydrothermal vent metagenome TaxID=652676 RepID=A0A3B0YVS7_9ZZZZ